MRKVCIVQARLNSSRLPGKVLYELGGLPMIGFLLHRLQRSRTLDEVVLATSVEPANDALAATVQSMGFAVFRGPEDDVLARYAGAALAHGADIVVRVTGDCPLVDPELIDRLVARVKSRACDFCTNVKPPTWPDGLDLAVFTGELLDAAAREAALPSDREHVVPWMWRATPLEGGRRFRAENVEAPHNWSNHRWTVDEPRDYLFLRAMVETMGHAAARQASCREFLHVLETHPDIATINRGILRDAGYLKSLGLDPHLAEGQPEGT